MQLQSDMFNEAEDEEEQNKYSSANIQATLEAFKLREAEAAEARRSEQEKVRNCEQRSDELGMW